MTISVESRMHQQTPDAMKSVDQSKDMMTEDSGYDSGVSALRYGRRNVKFDFNHVKRILRKPEVHVERDRRRRNAISQKDADGELHGMQTFPSNGELAYHRKLTQAWYNLSKEEAASLKIDIFKPLDFNEILMKKLKTSNNGKVISSMKELWE